MNIDFIPMRKILSVIFSLFLPLLMVAAERSDSEILAIARRMESVRPIMHGVPSANPVIIERATAYVAVNTADGFVLVGADDRMPEVLGWSDNSSFDRDNLPPALLTWLSEYEKEALSLNHTMLHSKRGTSEWTNYFDDERLPLLSTQWSQYEPFNNYCPASSDNTRCVTGCVATATAQIMNYYQYPAHGSNAHSYKWLCKDCGSYYNDSVVLSANFGSTTYVWNNMLDQYVAGNYMAVNAHAVAILMYHCGVAAEMNYGATESGAAIENAAKGMFSYFGYGYDMQLVYKDKCSIEQFMNIIHDDIKKGHPVLARGMSSTSGHAFVCDGYNSNGYFHFNWGWGGQADGYFLLSALNPVVPSGSKDYNSDVCFITNIYPDSLHNSKARSQLFCDSLQMVQTSVMRTGEKLNLTAYQLRNYSLFRFEGRIGVMLSNENTQEIVGVPWVSGDNPIPVGDGLEQRTGIRFEIPSSVPNGTYLLDLVYQFQGDSVWNKVVYRGGCEYGVKIKITDDEITRILNKPVVVPNPGDTITCEEAFQFVSSWNSNKSMDYTNTVVGYITKMEYDGVSQGQQQFWMSDTLNGGGIFFCDWGNVTEELYVGDSVAVTGYLTRHDSLPAMLHGQVELLKRMDRSSIVDGVLDGAFTINANGQKAYFSQGNLQYNASTNEWRFARNQFEYVGDLNKHIGKSYNGWIDLFGWGTSGWNSGANNYQPYSSNEYDSNYYPGGNSNNNLTGEYANADWGVFNTISNGGNSLGFWRTLTYNEWSYLLSERPDADKLQAYAVVNNINGYIILPDDFVLPTGSEFYPGRAFDHANIYNGADWLQMESAGAVFLPFAGIRNGNVVEGVGLYGRYWSSSAYGPISAYCVLLAANSQYVNVNNLGRHLGISVRLVYSPAMEDLIQTEAEFSTPSKLTRDGQILILRGDKTYTLTGQEVK